MLGAAVGAVVVAAAGCSASSLDPTSDDPTITPTSSPSADGEPAAVDDTALVGAVLAALAVAHRSARADARAHQEVAATLRPFERLHLVHARELGDLPRSTNGVGPSASPAQALARLGRREERLQRTLVEAATSAGSGALAQTLASMAGAVAQLRTTL